MVAVDDAVRLIILQFVCTNQDVVPSSVGLGVSEAVHDERKKRANGTLVVEPTKNVFLAELPGDLREAGYELVDAFYQRRSNPKTGRGYYMIRFVFCRHEHVDEGTKGFREGCRIILADLEDICDQALWQTRIFLNPFFKDGEEIPGQKAISINLDVRQPLFQFGGQSVAVWPKDEKGKRIGKSPQPLRPDHNLRIESGSIRLLSPDQVPA